jgi:hypothetical protein
MTSAGRIPNSSPVKMPAPLKGEFQRIGEIIDHTSALAHAGDWEALDEYVRNFDYPHEAPVFIIAVLRSTYPMREKLRFWKDAVERASRFVGEDELRGLL